MPVLHTEFGLLLGEGSVKLILRREVKVTGIRPLDVDGLVIPWDAAFIARIVDIVDLIFEDSGIA